MNHWTTSSNPVELPVMWANQYFLFSPF